MDDQTVLATDQPRASLVVSQGAQVGTTYYITGAEAILGRDEETEISVRDPEVSRRHARISWQSGNYYIEDLGSTNGTFLNSSLVTSPQPLRSGDTIGLGQTLFVFQTEADAMPAQPPPRPAYTAPPPPPMPAAAPADVEEPRSRNTRCLLWGCGCLILLGVLLFILVVAGILIFARDIQPVLDDLGIPIQLTMAYVTRL
ncbi:MAG: FHA domain-containing protein [Candidatus Thorarchaeota archaeon]